VMPQDVASNVSTQTAGAAWKIPDKEKEVGGSPTSSWGELLNMRPGKATS